MRITLSFLLILIHLQLVAQVSFIKEAFNDGPFGTLQNCAVDMNGDLLDDIVALNSKKLQIFYQQVDGSFTNKIFEQDLTYKPFWSICAGDIDGNGFNDLALGDDEGVSFLYANANGSAYTEDAKPDYIFSQRTSFADINNDGHLDAFICSDDDENQPFRNDGTGQLTLDYDLMKSPENLAGNYTTTWVDYDNDGDLDLHIAKCILFGLASNQGRINLLFNNDGNSNYTEVGNAAGLDDNDQSWVSLFEDYDNDGDFDIITFNHEMRNRFMVNNGDGTFSDFVGNVGISPNAIGTFEALAADFDNDGNMDIVTDNPAAVYYGNGDFTFSASVSEIPASSLADLNSDGFMDVLYRNEIFYNQGNDNHWLRVNTIGTESNRNGIGARLELYGSWGKQIREVRVTQSWSPMSTLSTHFGIGQATSIDSLVVKWPSGNKSVIVAPAIDQALLVDESDCSFQRVDVIVDAAPILCVGETATLTAPSGYASYLWSNGAVTQSIEVDSEGFYNVTVTDDNQCSSFSNLVQIYDVEQNFEIATPQGTEFCEGGSAILELNVPFDVEWSNGRTDNFNYIFDSGIYSATLLTDCDTDPEIEAVEVTEHILEPIAMPDVFLDTTQSTLFISLSDSQNPLPPGANILWWEDQDGDKIKYRTNSLFYTEFLSDTTYYVSYFLVFANNLECHSERTSFTVYPTAGQKEIILSSDPYLCEGDELELTAPTGYSYNWSNGETTSSIVVQTAGSYSVTLTDVDGNEEVLPAVDIYVELVSPPDLEDVFVDQGTPSIIITLPEDSLAWWDAPEGGNLLFVGNDLEHFIMEPEFTYYIEKRTKNGNDELCASERVPLTIRVTSSVSDLDEKNSIQLFPNPSNGNFSVVLDETRDLKEIKIRDVGGQLVFKDSGPFSKEIPFDLGAIESGIYLINFNYHHRSITKKIIVQN